MIRLKLVPIKVSKKFMAEKTHTQAVKNFMQMGAENIRVDFRVTTQTWKKNHPVFRIRIVSDSEREISTTHKIFKFISGGTRIRYATMSKDWISKTNPQILGSGPGRGRKLYVNRKIPRPGIEARMFARLIVAKWTPRWPQLFIQEIHNALQR